MNKTAIKNFAVRARRQLIEEISQKAYEAGIEKDRIHEIVDFAGGFRVKGRENGRVFKDFEKSQRKKLIEKLNEKGYEQLIEEVAYTWFNRFIAIRFMEVNDYLPARTRVLSSEEKEKIEPDILPNALQINLDVENEEKHQKKIFELEEAGDREDLYKYLLVKQCNQLGKIMPQVFEQIGDYTELLLPDKLLAEGSVIRDLVTSIEEYDWMIELSDGKAEENNGEHGIEIIGWLYQYYISEKYKQIVGMNKGTISKNDIPAATQLFTPKWIVKYMVENSLGRLWLESHPDEKLQESFKYYLEEAEQEPEVQKQLDELKDPNLDPETITVLDPAMGSGHILVYAFDVLYEIYQKQGYNERDIPKTIIERNLYGLDIDDRAGQLASFAILMKGRSKNRRFFRDQVKINVCAIQESNGIPSEAIEYLVSPKNTEMEKQIRKEDVEYLASVFKDAKEYGSILEVKPIDFETIERRVHELKNETPTDFYELQYRDLLIEKVELLIKQGKIMSEKYDVVCANPPYMGNKYINLKLKKFILKNYKDVKSDLFSVFIKRNMDFGKSFAHTGFMTPFVWMFISSYKELRRKIITDKAITSLIQLEYSGFEEATVPICAFTIRNGVTKEIGEFIRLTDFKGSKNQPIKVKEAIIDNTVNYRYSVKSSDFTKIPGNPIAYWVRPSIVEVFEKGEPLSVLGKPREGLHTGDTTTYVKMWTEVGINKISFNETGYDSIDKNFAKWIPYNKGGKYRKWYGNKEMVIAFDKQSREAMSKLKGHVRPSQELYFKKGITWSLISSSNFGVRCFEEGMMFDVSSHSFFCEENMYFFYAGLLNTKITNQLLQILNPTMNFSSGVIGNIPVIQNYTENHKHEIDRLVLSNIWISKKDWDSFENSWDFIKHPLLAYRKNNVKLEEVYNNWEGITSNRYNQLKENEEKLNRVFIEIYGLEDELTPEVEEKDVTVRKADKERDIKSFISYAIGCSFGRYSLDEEGLQYAGGNFEDHFKEEEGKWMINTEEGWKESSLPIVKTNIAPIIEGDYFEEDLLERVIQFVKVSFGEEALDENLEFIADNLGKKKTETPREAIRRYLLKDFYKDHVRIYKKRPIYWQFESGKQGAFKALIYMHRYDPYLVARLRTEYLHPLQKKYEAEVYQIDDLMTNEETSKSEIGKLRKQKETLLKKIDELKVYDQAIGHVANQQIDFDLDDGVKVNYEKFQGVEIPQGEGKKPLKENLLTKI